MTEKHKHFFLFLPLIVAVGFGFWWGLASLSKDEAKVQSDLAALSSSPGKDDQAVSNQPITSMDVKRSGEVAREFLASYLSYEAKEPTRHVKTASRWMTDEFYQKQMKEVIRPTFDMQQKRLVSIEKADSEVMEQSVQWTFLVIEEVTDIKGNKQQEEWIYVVTMIEQNNQWKVWGVDVHGTIE
jgi:hypothetical protein